MHAIVKIKNNVVNVTLLCIHCHITFQRFVADDWHNVYDVIVDQHPKGDAQVDKHHEYFSTGGISRGCRKIND